MKKDKKKIITICASASFYSALFEIEKELKKTGFQVKIPITARRMKKANNFNVEQHKTWYINPKEYSRKKKLMDMHFKKVMQADAILVVNEEKKGIKGYIGGNTLMEMTLAYYHKKPIFVWNGIEHTHPFEEEIMGMGSKIIDRDITKIKF